MFVKKLFGYGKKDTDKDKNDEGKSNDKSQGSTKNNTNTSNFGKCLAISRPFIDTTESNLRVDSIHLFDGNKLDFDKLYKNFVE